jgi:hypothetical protein
MSSIEDLFGKLAMTTVTTVSRIALGHATNAAIVSRIYYTTGIIQVLMLFFVYL